MDFRGLLGVELLHLVVLELDVRAAALPEALVELLPLGLRLDALPDRREPPSKRRGASWCVLLVKIRDFWIFGARKLRKQSLLYGSHLFYY